MKKNKLVTLLVFTLLYGGLVFGGCQNDKTQNDAIGVSSAKISAQEAIEMATSLVSGKIAKIEFDEKGSKMIWEIEVVTPDRKVFDIKIDANTGETLK